MLPEICSYEELMDFISLYKMNNEIDIHKGLIEKTLPKVLKENQALSFSFVFCDTDCPFIPMVSPNLNPISICFSLSFI